MLFLDKKHKLAPASQPRGCNSSTRATKSLAEGLRPHQGAGEVRIPHSQAGKEANPKF